MMRNTPELLAGGGEGRDATLFTGAIDNLLARIDATAASVGAAFPLSAPESGVWMTAPDGRWTGGFWVGQLWLAHLATGDAKYRALAEAALSRLEGRLALDNVLNGLVFYYAGALGAVLDGNQEATEIAKRGASELAGHFNAGAGFIPLGHHSGSLTGDAQGETNIDGVPGMGLLWWAAEELRTPALAQVAARHVKRHIELCMRDDGSLYQAALVDPASGDTLRRYSPRGFDEDTSTWARAQSWGLMGLVQAFAWSKDPAFYYAAVRAADWWIGAVPPDKVAFWDFNDPAIPATERDTSATAMSASALLKLSRLAPDDELRRKYGQAGVDTVRALVGGYLVPTHAGDARPRGMLTQGCWQRNQGMSTRHELVWGDYYLLEALMLLTGRLVRLV